MAKKISFARKAGRVIKSIVKIALVLVLSALMALGNTTLPTYARMINDMMGYEQSWDNSKVNTAGLDLDYNKTDRTKDTIKDAERSLDEQIAAEGYVLLKNSGNAMPFAQGTTFSFFGESGKTLASSFAGGSGSYDSLNSAFEAEGMSVNKTLEDFYTTGAGKDYALGKGSVGWGDSEDFSINECPLSVLQGADGVLDSAQGTVVSALLV